MAELRLDTKKRVLIIGVSILVVGIFYKYLYQPRIADLKSARTELKVMQANLNVAYQKQKNLPKLVGELKDAKQRLRILSAQLPEEKHISQFLYQITSLADKSGVKFISTKPTPVKDGEFYQRLSLGIALEGRYDKLGHYLKRLKGLLRVVSIDKIQIRVEEETLPNLRCKITTTTYFLK